ncbi:MAG: hypothetical protein M0P55_14095 [Clostridiales bacterium]|nr:hypothetical protein [Clostridiales bacterium]
MRQKNWHDDVFFGLHFDLHATEKDTELGRALTEDHLQSQLAKIRPDFVQCDGKGHPGYASYPTRVGVPSPGIVKDQLRIWRDVTREMGIPLVVHFSGIWDAAALKDHPAWGRVDRPGGDRSPKMVCPLSPYTDEYMIPQLLEIVDMYDVDGFWVDGENWASQPCYCPDCQAGFALGPVPDQPGQPLWDAWLAYSRANFVAHVCRYTDAVHRHKPGCTVCSNWMYTVRQPDRIDAPVDYISGDFSWIWSAARAGVEARFMAGRQLGWDLMAWGFSSHGPMQDWVFKSADALCQEAAVVMSCGGAFMVYDTPNRDGTLVGWHMDELSQVAAFCRARQIFCQGTQTVPQAVILHAPAHYYAHNDPLFNLGDASDALEGALHALLENGVSTDIRNDADLVREIDRYPLCVVAEQDNLSDALLDELERYVRSGGVLLVSGAEQTRRFDRLLGTAEREPGFLEMPLHIPVGPGSVCAMGRYRQVRPVDEKTEVIAPLLLTRDTGSAGRPSGGCAITCRPVGKGMAAGIFGPLFATHARAHYPAVRALIGQLLDRLDIPGLARARGPARVPIALRARHGQLLVHLVNLGSDHPQSPRSPLVEHVPPAGPVSLDIPMTAKPRLVRLMPAAEPVNWTYSDGRLRLCLDQVGIHDILVIDQDD